MQAPAIRPNHDREKATVLIGDQRPDPVQLQSLGEGGELLFGVRGGSKTLAFEPGSNVSNSVWLTVEISYGRKTRLSLRK
jgi:hypothetical protein